MAMVRKGGGPGSDIWERRREGNGAGALCAAVQWQMDGALLYNLPVALGKLQLVADAAQKVVATCALCLYSLPIQSLRPSAVPQRLQVKFPGKADVSPRACFPEARSSQFCSLPQQWTSSSFCPLTRHMKPVSSGRKRKMTIRLAQVFHLAGKQQSNSQERGGTLSEQRKWDQQTDNQAERSAA